MSQNNYPDQENFGVLKIIRLIIRNIWIIIACAILTMGFAFLYNRYEIPTYKVSATLLLKEDLGNSRSNGESRFINSDLLARNQNMQNELEIIKSYPTIEQTVKNLDLEVSYYEYKNYQYSNAYKAAPFKVFIFKEHPQLVGPIFNIILNSDGTYTLNVEKQDATVHSYSSLKNIGEKKDFELNLKGNVGQIIETDDFKFLITINDKDSLSLHNKSLFAFKLSSIKQLVSSFEKNLEFNIPDKLATIIEISLETASVQQGEDVINELIKVYSETNLAKKNHLANMTIEYIEKQLDEVSASLNKTGNNLQEFMSKNKVMNVNEQSTRLSEQRLNLQNELAKLLTQKRYYDYVTEYNGNNTDETQIIAPTSMGVQDVLLNNLIEELSSAQTQRANLIKNNQERNPIVSQLNIQIKNLKNTINENIAAAASTNEISINEMQNRITQIEKEISQLPVTQMQMGGIERNYNLNNDIYNYLLEKQAEAKITQASNLPDNIIIEPAHMVGLSPVSPNRIRNYMIALLLGLTLPVSVLLIKSSLKTTISTQEDIESITNATVLGKVLHNNNRKENNVFLSSPNNKTAETFRTLRTNLNFAMNSKSPKVVLVTSCLSGEGKSFNSLNIAASYAQMGKKTILLNFDLRNSQPIFKNVDETNGLSLYLNEESILDDIIQKTDFKNLDFINSGPVPPNPLDLMEKEITADLFKILKQNYEYIIVDTPPLAQVSDALTIIDYADLNLIVTRYNVTKKKLLRLVLTELKNKNIKNVNLILNDNKLVSEQMGYGYYK